MDRLSKPYVHVPIDAVNTVVFDAEGHFDGEQYDRYASFSEARDAALSSIEIMLDEEDYDGDDHRAELELMLAHLEASSGIEELEGQVVLQAAARPPGAGPNGRRLSGPIGLLSGRGTRARLLSFRTSGRPSRERTRGGPALRTPP